MIATRGDGISLRQAALRHEVLAGRRCLNGALRRGVAEPPERQVTHRADLVGGWLAADGAHHPAQGALAPLGVRELGFFGEARSRSDDPWACLSNLTRSE